ncbi:MAG: redoxin domain-containing protein, partial [Planctomycetota bacterium]|nr:redoxin domain-containing protein [Planctomycetota bacterium]
TILPDSSTDPGDDDSGDGDSNDDDNGDTDSGDDDEVNLVPDFSLLDVNETSSTYQVEVSPRDLNGNLSVYYFGLATCTYCATQFEYLDNLQEDLDTNHADIGVEIIGINLADRESGNASITAGVDLPWLQDVDSDADGNSDTWHAWGAQLRDVMIVDEQNQLIETINLTLNDLAEPANYDSLKGKIVGADTGEGEMKADDDWLVNEQLDEAIDSLARFFNR